MTTSNIRQFWNSFLAILKRVHCLNYWILLFGPQTFYFIFLFFFCCSIVIFVGKQTFGEHSTMKEIVRFQRNFYEYNMYCEISRNWIYNTPRSGCSHKIDFGDISYVKVGVDAFQFTYNIYLQILTNTIFLPDQSIIFNKLAMEKLFGKR